MEWPLKECISNVVLVQRMLCCREGKSCAVAVDVKVEAERVKDERMSESAPCIVWLNVQSLKIPVHSVKTREEEFQVQMESSLEDTVWEKWEGVEVEWELAVSDGVSVRLSKETFEQWEIEMSVSVVVVWVSVREETRMKQSEFLIEVVEMEDGCVNKSE